MSRRRAALWTVAIVLVAATAYVIARSKRDFWDFEVYRTAGIRAVAGEGLYRPEDGHYQFKYWPAFAIAMAPFGMMPPEAGKIVWYALSIGLIAFFMRQAILLLPNRRHTVLFLGWMTFLLTGKFIVKELVNGQTNALLGTLVVLALAALGKRRPGLAGVWLGLAAFVKPYALLFVPWVAVAAGVIGLASMSAVMAAGLVLPAAIYGWTGNLALLSDWYRTVMGTTPENLMLAENISFLTMWSKWIGPGTPASMLALATSAVALAAGGLIWLLRRRTDRPEYLEASYLLLLVPVLSPQGWDYVLLLATPAIVCLVDRFRAQPIQWRIVTTAGLLLTSATIFDLTGRWLYLNLMALSAVTVGAILLGIALISLRVRAAA